MSLVLQQAVDWFFYFLNAVIFIRVIASWIPALRENNGLMKILYTLTEPILGPIRTALRKSPLGGPGMMIDFSAVIALGLIQLLRALLLTLIAQMFGAL